jgi:hypothetical protein
MQPTGVVLIAIYHFLTAALLMTIGLVLAVGGSMLGAFLGSTMNSHSATGAGLGLLLGVVGAAVFFVFGLVAIVAGYGIWTMREWGRILSIVLAALALLFALPGLMFMLVPTHFFLGGFLFGGFGLIRIVISVLIIWYLVQPNVRAIFQQAASAPLPPA